MVNIPEVAHAPSTHSPQCPSSQDGSEWRLVEMTFRIRSAVECAWKLRAREKEAEATPSLELPKRLSTICAGGAAKVVNLLAYH